MGEPPCSDSGESAASGRSEGEGGSARTNYGFRWPGSFLPHGSEAMVSQGWLREELHDLHVRGEGKGRSLQSPGEEPWLDCGTRQAHGRAGRASPCLLLKSPACLLGSPAGWLKALGFGSASRLKLA